MLGDVNQRICDILSPRDDASGADVDVGLRNAIRLSLTEDEIKRKEDDDLQAAIRLSLLEDEADGLTSDGHERPPSLHRTSNDRPTRPLSAAEESQCKLRNSFCCPQVPFEYTKLTGPGQIRLLRREPWRNVCGKFGWSMIVTSLDSPHCPEYTTLSYAWGDTHADGSHLTDTIHCNANQLRVSRNVRIALDRICETTMKWRPKGCTGSYLWVDSICINQADPQERGHQVKQMARIYAQCRNILIWLGEHSEAARRWQDTYLDLFPNSKPSSFLDPRHVEFLRYRWERTLAEILRLEKLLESPCIEIPDSKGIRLGLESLFNHAACGISAAGFAKSHDAGELEAYAELINRPWFQRKWVIQEVAQTAHQPRHIIIADKVLDFQEVADRVDEHSLMGSASPLRAGLSQTTLLQNLNQYQNTRCTDPHDHIYALLGLSKDCSWLPIDYNQDVSDLYQNVAEYYIIRGNMTAVFALATAKRSLQGLPSWVPDWRNPSNCERSGLLADAIAALNLGARKLFDGIDFTPEQPDMSVYGLREGLGLNAWILRRCRHQDLYDSTCRQSSKTQKAKAPMRDTSTAQSSQELLNMRKYKSRQKYGLTIREQFQATIQDEEVLCLLDDSPFAFVMRPVSGCKTLSYTLYTLEFCFQVDQIGWMSHWIAHELRNEPKETFRIV